MRHRAAPMMALLAILLTTPLHAQQAPDQRIRQTLARAAEAGIPVRLLESKVAEGRAKNIPLDRIAAVVERRAQMMVRARDVLRAAAADRPVAAEEIAVGADALEAGVSEQILAQVAATEGQSRRTVAIAALTQLVAAGVVPEQALGRVQAALARGPDALSNLPGVVGRPGGDIGPPPGVPATGRPPGAGRPPKDPPGGGPPGNGPPGNGGGSGGTGGPGSGGTGSV